MLSAKVWFRLEVALAGLSLLALAATLVWANWIELLFGVEPDGGGGGLERIVGLSLTAATAIVMAALAVRNWLARRNVAKAPIAAKAAGS